MWEKRLALAMQLKSARSFVSFFFLKVVMPDFFFVLVAHTGWAKYLADAIKKKNNKATS